MSHPQNDAINDAIADGTLLVESDIVIPCDYCKNLFDSEETDFDTLEKLHKDHVEFMWHNIDPSICATCEGDEPAHCPAWCDGAIDGAMMMHGKG